MTENERKLALYCLKANSDYHSEVCEECIKYPNCDHTGQDDVTETIIKALEQKPCSNAIDRAEAIYIASGFCHPANVAKELAKLPPVTPEPKMGQWIEEDMFDGDVAYRCSECKELFWIESGTPKDNEYNFCPKCGKRLIKPQE